MKSVVAVDGATRDTLNGVCVGVGAGAKGVNAKVVLVEVDVVCTVYITVLTGGGFAREDVGAAGVCEARGVGEGDVGEGGVGEGDVGEGDVGEGDVGLRGLRLAMILR